MHLQREPRRGVVGLTWHAADPEPSCLGMRRRRRRGAAETWSGVVVLHPLFSFRRGNGRMGDDALGVKTLGSLSPNRPA